MPRQWVVTYRFEVHDNVLVTEFFRGDREECDRICDHFAPGEDDRVQTGAWRPILGTAKSWDIFLEDAAEDDSTVVVVVSPNKR